MDLNTEALKIIRSTRSMSLPAWGNIAVDKAKEGVDNVVTKIDYEIEQYLKEAFATLDSSIGFAGEEFGGDKQADHFWLTDPIDGTSHFVRGLPFCTTMVSRIQNGQVVFSAIYDFVQDKMYHAAKGEGAFCNDTPIHVSDRDLKTARISVEANLDIEKSRELFYKITKKIPAVTVLSSGWEAAMVASGALEGRITINPYGMDHDFAPGSLLIAEAGGVVRNLGSDSYSYTNLDFIAANPRIYEVLCEGPDAVLAPPNL